MSAESRRHLTHRRTRFRSSSNNEQGSVDENIQVDVMQHIFPNNPPTEPVILSAEKVGILEIRPAGFIGLGFAMLFMGLHQYIWSSPGLQPPQHGNLHNLSLLFTIGSAVTQFLTGLRERVRAEDGTFAFLFHCTYGFIWIAMALPQLLLVRPPLTSTTKDVLSTPSRRAASVAASMLLMAAAFTCLGFAMRAREMRYPFLLLLTSMGSALLCFSRAQFQLLHNGAAAAATNQYGGGLLVVSSFFAFRIAWRALEREMPCKRACTVIVGQGT